MTYLPEKLQLPGEGEYNLNNIIEINGTESYFGLDQDVRECQNDEPTENCTTRRYHDTMLRECGCLPFNIRTSDKVYLFTELGRFVLSK